MQNRKIYLLALFFTGYFLMACNNGKPGNHSTKTNSTNIAASKMNPAKTIAENIINDSDYATLASALKTTDLLETLDKPGPFTVFAPPDEAFNKLPDGTIEGLMNKRKNDLANILSYHIIAGSIKSNELKDGEKLKTFAGEELTVSFRNGNLAVNGTNVITRDVICSNGVIHIIDGVLFPLHQQSD